MPSTSSTKFSRSAISGPSHNPSVNVPPAFSHSKSNPGSLLFPFTNPIKSTKSPPSNSINVPHGRLSGHNSINFAAFPQITGANSISQSRPVPKAPNVPISVPTEFNTLVISSSASGPTVPTNKPKQSNSTSKPR